MPNQNILVIIACVCLHISAWPLVSECILALSVFNRKQLLRGHRSEKALKFIKAAELSRNEKARVTKPLIFLKNWDNSWHSSQIVTKRERKIVISLTIFMLYKYSFILFKDRTWVRGGMLYVSRKWKVGAGNGVSWKERERERGAKWIFFFCLNSIFRGILSVWLCVCFNSYGCIDYFLQSSLPALGSYRHFFFIERYKRH